MTPRTTSRIALPLLLTLLVTFLAGAALAGEVNFAWDPSDNADGYRAHYGTISGQYSVTTDVNGATEINITTLADCTTWYFTATAYNSDGESAYAPEISSWPRPVIGGVAPSSAERGRTLDITISGTNFQTGDTLQFTNPGIQLNSMSVDSCGSIRANVTIGGSASTGPVEISLAHGSGVIGRATMFGVDPTVAPTVASSAPQNGATGVSADVEPTIRFSEAMAAGSISASTVRLLDAGGSPVAQAAGSPSLSPDGLVATIVPAGTLAEGATYRIQALGGGSGVRDLAGNGLSSTFLQGTGFTIADPSAPQLSSIQADNLTGTSARITWNTDEPATSRAFYRRSGDSTYQQTSLDSSLVTAHTVQLGGLDPDTDYEYHVESTDAAGNTATSSDRSFTTADTVPPQISSIQSSGVGDTSATIGWSTDEPATGQVLYRRSGDTTYQQTSVNSSLLTNHSVQLAGLDSGTTYEYHVRSDDAAGNTATSSPDGSFTTSDTSAPQISSVQAGGISPSTAVISWTTDQASDSQVFYRRSGDTSYDQTSVDSALVTSHSLVLSGLDDGTTYEYHVRSADPAGNAAVSSPDQVFTTTDTVAPGLSSIRTSSVTGTSVVILWNSDEPADSQVFYRRSGTSTYQQTGLDPALETAHSVTLGALDPSTEYEFHVRSADGSGNATVSSPDQTFTTSTVNYTYLTVEAESGTLTSPLTVVSGGGAFGGEWVEVPHGESNGSPSSPTGTATFDVNLPATATWYLWVRMYGPNDTADTWFESIDGATRQVIGTSQTGVWEWVAGRSYLLSQGLHAVELGGRRDDARIDQILLTDDPAFVPTSEPAGDETPPGPVTQFSATAGIESNQLSWTNPSDGDFARTVIRYRTDGQYPTSPTDGQALADRPAAPGSPDSFTHAGLIGGVTYYYSAFALDETGNVAPAAQANAQPSVAGEPPLPPGNLMLTFLDSAPFVQDVGSGERGWHTALRWAERRRRLFGTA